jgi:hypothetical protein
LQQEKENENIIASPASGDIFIDGEYDSVQYFNHSSQNDTMGVKVIHNKRYNLACEGTTKSLENVSV